MCQAQILLCIIDFLSSTLPAVSSSYPNIFFELLELESFVCKHFSTQN